jgi:hypothetical protein
MLIAFRLFFFERSKGISMYKRKEAKKKRKEKKISGANKQIHEYQRPPLLVLIHSRLDCTWYGWFCETGFSPALSLNSDSWVMSGGVMR